MNNSQLAGKLVVGILGLLFYALCFSLFHRAIFREEFIFRGGIIRGSLVRILGIIGMLGITAGAYLGISFAVFHVEPPGMPVAMFLLIFFGFMMISLKFLSIFWHPK
jgi:hypothetical protein